MVAFDTSFLCLPIWSHIWYVFALAQLDFVNLYNTQLHPFFFSRHVPNNQLTDLPEGLFGNTTQLRFV